MQIGIVQREFEKSGKYQRFGADEQVGDSVLGALRMLLEMGTGHI
jgi:hypothetical protein